MLSFHKKGFTLPELIVIIAIFAIIVAIAYPKFIELLKNKEAKTTQNKITSILKTAKTESLIRRQNLTFCLAHDNNVCHKNAQDKLLLFTNSDNNNLYDEGNDHLLNQTSLNLKYGKVYLRAGRRNHVKFYGNTGTPRGHMGHVKYCPEDSEIGRMYQVSFNMVGGIKIKPKRHHNTNCPA